jgi:two-component system, response regulator PdtaR
MADKTRILVVDDDRLVLTTIAAGLRNASYDVVEAATGVEAIRLAEEMSPALALLDVSMPEVNGLDVAKHLRDHTRVAFMFLSAYSDDVTVHRATEYGAVGYLVKPIDVTQIIPAIHAALIRAKELRALKENAVDLSEALERGRDVNRAIGVLMERHRLDRESAFAALRDEARRQRRKISEFAAEYLLAIELVNFPALRGEQGRTVKDK